MRLYIDTDTGELRRELTGPVLTGLAFYLRDIVALEIVFITGGVAVTTTILAASALMKVALKANLSTTTLLALGGSYTLNGSVAALSFSLNTTEALAYFRDSVGDGARDVPLYFEIEVTAADESTRQTYHQSQVTVRRDVNQPGDPGPTSAGSELYVLKGSLFDANGNPISDKYVAFRSDITSSALHRAATTLGRTKPALMVTYESSIPFAWLLRAIAPGEVDDDTNLRIPTDDPTSIWAHTTIN